MAEFPCEMSAEERVVYPLRKKLEQMGYAKYHMRKFEEYGLYAENKSFLRSEHIITFNDLDGKLLALKPDVTLSIVKNIAQKRDGDVKLYYNESVYRADGRTHEYREIGQMGLEYIGHVDAYAMLETVMLAIEALHTICEEYMLDVSSMAFVAPLFENAGCTEEQKSEMMKLLSQKNAHEMKRALERANVSAFYAERIAALPTLSGAFEETLQKARALVVTEGMQTALDEMETLYQALSALGLSDRVRLDFSIVNDVDYYNGIVFQGYVSGAPRVVLSGGRYDKLLAKMQKDGQAIGFAVYLDELTRLLRQDKEYDVDMLVLYSENDPVSDVMRAVLEKQREGISVRAAVSVPREVRFGMVARYENGQLIGVKAQGGKTVC